MHQRLFWVNLKRKEILLSFKIFGSQVSSSQLFFFCNSFMPFFFFEVDSVLFPILILTRVNYQNHSENLFSLLPIMILPWLIFFLNDDCPHHQKKLHLMLRLITWVTENNLPSALYLTGNNTLQIHLYASFCSSYCLILPLDLNK